MGVLFRILFKLFRMVTAATGALAQEKGINKTYKNSTCMIKGKLEPIKTRTYMKTWGSRTPTQCQLDQAIAASQDENLKLVLVW